MTKRQKFSPEFKLEAVRLVKESGRPITSLAKELGVDRKHLYEWVKAVDEAADPAKAFPGSGAKPMDQRSEIERLKRELDLAREENEILKKAAAYFARNQR